MTRGVEIEVVREDDQGLGRENTSEYMEALDILRIGPLLNYQ